MNSTPNPSPAEPTDSPFHTRMIALGQLRKADLLGVLTAAKPHHDYTMRDTRFNIINEILDIEFPEGSSNPPPAPPMSADEQHLREHARRGANIRFGTIDGGVFHFEDADKSPAGSGTTPTPPAPTDEERDHATVTPEKVAQLAVDFFGLHDNQSIYIFHPEFGEEYQHSLGVAFAEGNVCFVEIGGETFRLTVSKEG